MTDFVANLVAKANLMAKTDLMLMMFVQGASS